MDALPILLLCSIITAIALAYWRQRLWVLAGVFAAVLVLLCKLTGMSMPETMGAGFLYLLIFIPLCVIPLRRSLITKKLFRLYRALLPPMSATEREAIETGDVWWDAELFSGRPDWKKLQTFPVPGLSDEEQAFLDGPVEELCNKLDDWHITHERQDLPPEVWDYIKEHRFFAMIIPKQYGGLEFSALAHSEVILKLSTRCIAAAVTVMVPNSLGPAILLLEYGTGEQKDHFLPRLASGEEIPCFALTAPEAGSDAGGMTDFGIVCKGEYDGEKDVLGIRLTWNKRYITLAPIATLLGLAFKLYDPDRLLGDAEDVGITLALIPTDHPGVETDRRHNPIDVPFQNGPTSGKDVFIPIDWIIGGRERAGQGWRMLMECLSDGRGISLPALSTGAGKMASRTTGAYARIRKQFRVPIGEFEGVQEALARIAGYTYLMDSARLLTLGALDQGESPSVVTAIIKYHLTERMRQVINDAMDVHGGKGIILGPRNYLAHAYQSVPVSITVEGANILTRNMIIFGQGVIRCHPYVLDEIEAAAEADTVAGLKQFDRAVFGHIGFTISNVARVWFMGLTGGRLVRPPVTDATSVYYRQLTRMSSALALLADVAMLVLGGDLKRRERLSARLGDILSQLYMASAVLKHFRDQGGKADDLPLVDWNCRQCLYAIEEAIIVFLNNFPIGFAGVGLKWLVFPYGRVYRQPDDALDTRVAHLIMQPGDSRDRLIEGSFVPSDRSAAVRIIEDTLDKVIDTGPLEHRVVKAMRRGELEGRTIDEAMTEAVEKEIVTDQEADVLRDAIKATREVIEVDDFDMTEFNKEKEICREQEDERQVAQSV
ncbi:MAG: acyl-CoA dehydrogenase [Gammaproteobacteria bacterium]